MFDCKCLLLAVCWMTLVRSQTLQCVTQRSAGVSVAVSSVRNLTGHWISKVTLGHDNAWAPQSAPWTVEVEPGTTSCPGQRSTYDVTLTITTDVKMLSASPTPSTASQSTTSQSTSQKLTPTTTSQPTTPTTSTSPSHQQLPSLSNYNYHTLPTTWPLAKQICEEERGHLVILNSDAEAAAIMELMKKSAGNVHGSLNSAVSWVGLRESNTTDGEFFTIFGEPLESTGYARWRTGRPNAVSLEDFVIFWSDGDKLQDWPANSAAKFAFTCELPLKH